uniref:Zinc finger protein 160 n=1 Tax=Cacopsylla melanoneura TaxID=428564 RepID=A0A8D9AE40_9HEMI
MEGVDRRGLWVILPACSLAKCTNRRANNVIMCTSVSYQHTNSHSHELLHVSCSTGHNVYERIISTYQLSLTHILFSKMPPEHFLPVIVQINPRHGNDEGVKYKVCWKCNLCDKEMDMWSDHDCEDVFTGDVEERLSYEEGDSTMGQDDDVFDESEDPSYINKENTGVETYVVNQGEGYKKITKIKPARKKNEITKHMCKKCNIIFFKDSYFFEHVREKHAIPVQKKSPEPWSKGETLVMGKYYCQPCKLMFANEKWLAMHHQTDHRHQPGYKPEHDNQPKAPPSDRSERTCYDCKGILFESPAWYKYHRQTKHGDTFDPSELPPTIRGREKLFKPNATKKGFQGGVHLKFEPNMEPEEDELVPDDGTPLEPKLLRTCTLCAKVKNSISSLRKHLRDVHEDTSIMTEEEEEKFNNKDTEVLIETLDGVMKEEIHEPDTNEELYDIDENSAITRGKPARPGFYKFKQDGLALEDVQKRYNEYHVLEMDAYSKKCEICTEDEFETQPKLLKHLETNHLAEICVESFYLIKKRRQRELQRRSKRVEILDANTLSDEVRAKVNTVMESQEDKDAEPVLIEIDLMGDQETEYAIEHLVSEETQDDEDTTINESTGQDTTMNESTGQPPAKKCKFEIVKPDDLTPAVRRRIDEQAKSLNIDTPVYIRNLGTNFEDNEKHSFDHKTQDRTNKVTVQILDYLSFREKLQDRVNKRLHESQEKSNKRAIALQEKALNKLESRINSKIAKETSRIARENAKIATETRIEEGINKIIKTSRNFSVTDFNGDPATSCMSCRVSFTSARRMERHKEMFHKNCSECTVCSLLIQDQAMETHMRGHDASGSIEFTCKECNNSFESEEHLSYHRLVHQNKVVVLQKQRCEHCYAEFFDPDMLKNHLKIHSTRRIYSCNFCHKHFYVLAEKVVHERIHTGVKPYACDQCGKAFRKKFSLTVHVRHVHLKEKRYQCDLCSQKFVTNSSLVVHKQRHDNTPRFKCKMCPKMFTNTGTRANHIRRYHYGTVEYVCKVCTRVFLTMAALRRHYAKHGTLKYPCHYCPQEYGRSLYLTKHLKEAHNMNDVTVK